MNKWAALFPAPSLDTEIDTDPTFLFGDWVLDAKKSAAVLKYYGDKPSDTKAYLARELKTMIVHRFSPEFVTRSQKGKVFYEHFFCGFRRQGNRVVVLYRLKPSEDLPKGGTSILKTVYGWDGECLVEDSGLAFRRAG